MPLFNADGWTLVDSDPETGRRIWGYHDGAQQHFRIDYPVDETIKENAEARASARSDWKGDWHRVASIRLNVLHDSGFADAVTQEDRGFIKRFLNDGDNAAWRTKDGKI